METGSKIAIACLVGLAACGGSSNTNTAPATNAFTGTITITSALPAGTIACTAVHTVTFTAGGASPKAVTAAGGECVRFTNSDSLDHEPGWRAVNKCEAELTAPVLSTGQSYTTPPLGGPKLCDWMDVLNPPGTGGGGH